MHPRPSKVSQRRVRAHPEIPADYSEKVSSLTGSNPEQAQLRIISDGA